MASKSPHSIPIDKPAVEPTRWNAGLHITSAVLSMAMLYVAFPDPGFSILAHVALAPMIFIAVRSPRPWMMALSSLLAAYAFWLARIAWLTEVTPGGYGALALVMALYTPVSLLGIRWLVRRLSIPVTLAAPMVWVSLEFLRGYCPAGGFGWFALSHSQASYSPEQSLPILAQCADLFGEHGVSFLVAMSNGVAVDLVVRPIKRFQGVSRLFHSSATGLALWAVLMIAAIGYGLSAVHRSDDDLDRFRVAVIQTNVPQSNKVHPTPQTIEDDFQHLVDLTRLASSGLDGMAGTDLSTAPEITSSPGDPERPDLIVWPETMVPAGLNAESRAYYARAQTSRRGHQKFFYATYGLAHEQAIPLLVGAPWAADFRTIQTRDRKHTYEMPLERYNSAYLFPTEGDAEPARYDKMHRVPFGEYVPWVDSWPALKDFFMANFTPYDYDYSLRAGNTPTVFLVNAIDRVHYAEVRSRNRLDLPWDLMRDPAMTQPAEFPQTQPGGLATQPVPQESTTSPVAVTAPATAPSDAAALPRRVVRFATPICFEDTVARVCRQMAYDDDGVKRIDALINLTNDGWYPGWAQGRQHLQIATLRCIENRVPMARSVNTGVSGFISSSGQVLQLVQDHHGKRQEVEGFATHDLALDSRTTLFGRIGHWPVAILIVITGVLVLISLFKGEPKQVQPAVAIPANGQGHKPGR